MADIITQAQPIVDMALTEGAGEDAEQSLVNAGLGVGRVQFEDYFPKLDLSEEAEASIARWLIKDLKSCVTNVDQMRPVWALYRSVFTLEYVEAFYPDMGMGAEFASGVLCDKVLEAMDRLNLSIFSPRPLFVVDDKVSNTADISVVHRLEWFLHTVLVNDLNLEELISPEGLFNFVLDGSMILEADQMYEIVPQRTIQTYSSMDQLANDFDKVINRKDYDKAMEMLMTEGTPQRVLIEKDLMTKKGLQFFLVDKLDHLIPPNVYTDRDIRFRGRRMYLTEADLRLLASDDTGWYDKVKVDKVIETRRKLRNLYSRVRKADSPVEVYEELQSMSDSVLGYDWRRESGSDDLGVDESVLPYQNTWTVYRVLCKYGYKTKSDSKGLIPKYCMFDIEPESRQILRAVTYPHFHEMPNYFHFKMGYAPNRYYGFGFGARLINEDRLESNAVNLYLNSAAMATYNPFLCVHPEDGGRVPFSDGIGPVKIGYVRNTADFKALEIPPPPQALIGALLPIVATRAGNRTSITSLVQGQTESSDPRSPAQKAAMLIREASIGIDNIIKDWNKTWNKVAQFVWKGEAEKARFEGEESVNDRIVFPGYGSDVEDTNIVSIEELEMDIRWQSQAASDYLNSEMRQQEFLRQFQFFAPMIQQFAVINPELYKKYFLRWMIMAAREMNIRNFKYLIPTEQELATVPPEQLMSMMSGMFGQLKDGQSQVEGPIAQQTGGVNGLGAG